MFKLPETPTADQVEHLLNVLPEGKDDYDQMRADAGTFPIRIDEERFMYFLEVLPPCKWRHTAYEETFYVMEALTDGPNGMLYTWVVRIDKKFYMLAGEGSQTHSQIVTFVRDCLNLAYKVTAPPKLWSEYCIYAAQAADLGWNLKCFDEWVNS